MTVRYRAGFACIDGQLPGGEVIPLCRLRYGGPPRTWGFAQHDHVSPRKTSGLDH